jgi:hypothetical protein|tara:strand:+ start:1478 stop:2002 length:525 start_codon:yes stop_codon:yes gene_type:complete
VVFKPLNFEGFDDDLEIEKSIVVKFFQQGDHVKILEGKYSGEDGIVMSDGKEIIVKDGKCMPATPMVKLGNTQREIPVNANILKLKNDRDIVQAERAHHEEKGPKKHLATPFNVGDIVVTNGNKTYGYVFEAASETIKIVTDRDQIKEIRHGEVERKVAQDKRITTKDAYHETL